MLQLLEDNTSFTLNDLGTMARGYRDTSTECKVYIGDLSKDAEEKEIERAFGYYGRLKSVWVARNPPGFAFVEYEDPKDAEDAVRALDGTCVKFKLGFLQLFLQYCYMWYLTGQLAHAEKHLQGNLA